MSPTPPAEFKISSTFWFGALFLTVFLWGQVCDDVRHGHENLVLGFGIPFWSAACGVAVIGARFTWQKIALLRPQHAPRAVSRFPVYVGCFLAMLLKTGWDKSPWGNQLYDATKISFFIFIATLLLALIFQRAGIQGLLCSLLVGVLSAVATVGTLVALIFFVGGSRDVWTGLGAMVGIGIPAAVCTALYDFWLNGLKAAGLRRWPAR
jgi:hypothetical protein